MSVSSGCFFVCGFCADTGSAASTNAAHAPNADHVLAIVTSAVFRTCGRPCNTGSRSAPGPAALRRRSGHPKRSQGVKLDTTYANASQLFLWWAVRDGLLPVLEHRLLVAGIPVLE